MEARVEDRILNRMRVARHVAIRARPGVLICLVIPVPQPAFLGGGTVFPGTALCNNSIPAVLL